MAVGSGQSAVGEEESFNLLEVGPGKGMLTKYLLERNVNLLVVEADRDMVEILNGKYPALHGKIIEADFLKLDFNKVFSNPESQIVNPSSLIPHPSSLEFSLVGNFPYNISSQIVFKMLENRQRIPELVGMFQKEMAERIIAPHGGKDYGVISVLTQAFYSGKYLFTVGSGNFSPAPKVQSAVIRLLRKDEPLGCDYALFRQVVKQAFSQRRKMLRNTMKPFFKDPEPLESDFFRKRPEELSVGEFVGLTNMVSTHQTFVGGHDVLQENILP